MIGWSVYVCAKEQPSLAPCISHSFLTSHGSLVLTENTHRLGSVTSSSGSESCLIHNQKRTKAAVSDINHKPHFKRNPLFVLF